MPPYTGPRSEPPLFGRRRTRTEGLRPQKGPTRRSRACNEMSIPPDAAKMQWRHRGGARLTVREARLPAILGLVLAAADRRAEDVAEAGAGIGRAEFLHRALLLVDLACLDRQRDPAGGAVDRGDLGVDPLADRKAIGALFAAVARQLGFADEAGHVVGQHDLDTALGDARNRAGDDLALAQGHHALLERVGFELLDAEADALLVDIDVEHLDAHGLALAVVLDGVLAGAVPVDIRQVHHAVDIAGQADKQPELGRVAHLALDCAADRVLLD